MKRAACIWLLAALLLACSKGKVSGGATDSAADASLPVAIGAPSGSANDDEVRPVYPLDVTPEPLAIKLCDALHELPERRRAACCTQAPQTLPTAECVRMTSAALKAKAVLLTADAIDACRVAMERSHEGCDWVGPFPPPVPPACLSLFRGGLAAKARCRSSLECAEGLRCHGVGPTTVGVCGPPREDGASCVGSSDALAAVTRQDDLDATHRECAGFCDRVRCAPLVAVGAACRSTRQCGPDRVCEGLPSPTLGRVTAAPRGPDGGEREGRCVARKPAALGEACSGDTCARGLRCVDGRCASRKAAGASCERDFECLGGCVAGDGGAKKRCGMKCDVR